MKSAGPIIKILTEQVQSYKMLVELLKRERTCLVDFDAEGVEELSKEKDTLVLRIRLLEEERIRLMSKFSDGDMSLQKLGELTGDQTIQAIRLKLISLLQSIEELNEFNRILIDRSLSYIKNTRNFFSSFGVHCDMKKAGTFLTREA